MLSRLVVLALLALACVHAAQAAGDDGTLFIGGDQTPTTGPAGRHLTTYNLGEENFASVNWGCNGIVRRIKVVGSSVWLAGDFTDCDNTRFGPLVRYDLTTGEYNGVLPQGAYFTNAYDTIPGEWGRTISIRDIKLYKGVLYIAGLFAINFTSTNEVAYNVAALDTRTMQWKLFGDGVNGRVNSIWVQDEQTLLLGGRFTRTGYKGTQDPNRVVFFRDPGFAVWHEDHPIYGTGYMGYTIPFNNNNFDRSFAYGWRHNMSNYGYEVFAVWRGMLQIEPQGEILNPPVFTPEPERLTIVLAGNFPGGVIYQQDALPWKRPNGGLWGGAVYALEPYPEGNAFFFGGAFTHSGNENATLGSPQNGVTQWNYQNLWHQTGSVLPPHFDWLQGGVQGGVVYGLDWEESTGQLYTVGSFELPYQRIAAFDVAGQQWLPVGEGNEFTADLYATTLANVQAFVEQWSGSWDSPAFPGVFYTCVVGDRFYGGFGYVAFEGQLTADGKGVFGTFVTAGASDADNRGRFAFVLADDLMSFSGYYAYDGQMGTTPLTGTRIAFITPDLITQCLATDDTDSGTADGGWLLATDDSIYLRLCLVGLDAVTASSNRNGGRYYTGFAVFPGKIVQAQWYDATGYGMSLFTQASADLMVEQWFAGDVAALDPDSDCVLGVTCGTSVWLRGGNATDDQCAEQAAFAAWTGTWTGCGLIAGSEFSLRPDGTGKVHGYFLGGLIEGQIAEDNPYRLEGTFIAAGFDAVVGAIRGVFAFEVDVDAPWNGRSFRGNFTMNSRPNGGVLRNPFYFTCNSQRIRSLLPLAKNTFLQLPDAGATIDGVWLKPDGSELAICVEEPGRAAQPSVVASSTSPKKRFYQGDAYTIDSEAIEFFKSYASTDANGRDTASLSYWNADGTVGLAIIRRISNLEIEESWFDITPARGVRFDFNLRDCTPSTCQFPDRGSNQVIYTYVRPVTTEECEQYRGFQPLRAGDLALVPESGRDSENWDGPN